LPLLVRNSNNDRNTTVKVSSHDANILMQKPPIHMGVWSVRADCVNWP